MPLAATRRRCSSGATRWLRDDSLDTVVAVIPPEAMVDEFVEVDADEVAAGLCGRLQSVEVAVRPARDGGLPERPGLYAWWMSPGAIRNLEGPAHPTDAFQLLYVGIAPKDAASQATLRSRILGQHLGGNIGSSTFRQSLAALLYEDQDWKTRWSGSRTQLDSESNSRLNAWQRDYLRLVWVERPRPWLVESDVIGLMHPPLNLAGNAAHPLYRRLKDLRKRLRDSSAPPEQAVPRPSARPAPATSSSDRDSGPVPDRADERRSQRITASDIRVGQVRIPRTTKPLFPPERQNILVVIRGQEITCRWDPRYGPPERSGVLRIGRAASQDLLRPGDVLDVRQAEGHLGLD